MVKADGAAMRRQRGEENLDCKGKSVIVREVSVSQLINENEEKYTERECSLCLV
jgi:hypothetical protein